MFMLAFIADQEILPMIDKQLALGNGRVSSLQWEQVTINKAHAQKITET